MSAEPTYVSWTY